ncbi:MAG TPA: thioredoxin domain-containing protein, partial [Acidimicrobiales bacterium]|nr:thioredoxin domain-containing protein [Acidimicrobiales bacterium]
MNRLAESTSPYLRQHQDNPVDWYPWGDDAFARAKAEDKPIMLSVGYSACHWCHVMAHESFEDADTAAVINELFVNVKVDREERPDVDAIYMDATQAMTGHGGWPMTVFCDPDGRPFYCGTYFPKQSRGGMPSFVDVCRAVDDAWRNRRADLIEHANELTAAIGKSAALAAPDGRALPGVEVLTAAYSNLRAQHDDQWGGFGGAPKFPQSMSLELLLRAHDRSGAEPALQTVRTSLDAMASGGMYDHLGGGFARYAVDAIWLVPHFEKMLYDQALLARTYLHAWQVTGSDAYAQVVEETIEYVLRDLRHPDGGFYSAEDADSEGVEGKFYVWTPDEMRSALADAPELADAAIRWYGVTGDGNFEGTNILNRITHRGELIRPPEIDTARARLLAARAHRVRPGLDDKVLAEWNGLMLATLGEAAAAMGRMDWLDAARTTGAFLLRELRRPDGRWLRSWQAERRAHTLAFAADYGALVDAFTRLGEATGEARWITAATDTADGLLRLFWDDDAGGLFTTGHDGEQLVARPKDLLDNATPAANSLAAVGLLRLGALTGVGRYRKRADDILRLLGGVAGQHPTAFAHLLAAVDLVDAGVTEVAIVGDRPDLVRTVQSRYSPNAVLAWGEPYESPLWQDRREGYAYVCREYACRAPVDAVDELLSEL